MASILKVNTIQDATNSNTAMSIDSTGRILTPARPSFRAKRSGSATTVSSGNDIIFDDVTTATHGCHNIGSHYNTSTGIFTAPIEGVYFFAFNVYQDNANDGQVDMYIGSQSVFTERGRSDGASYDTLSGGTVLKLSASNQVKLSVTLNSIYIDTNVHSFCGYLIG